eukprot:243831-Prorocentrum_minimum.AAC.2
MTPALTSLTSLSATGVEDAGVRVLAPLTILDSQRGASRPVDHPGPGGPLLLFLCGHLCGLRYTERSNHSAACAFHPGPPVFHERKKQWSCCQLAEYDFDAFLQIPPCAVGPHTPAAQ